MLGFAYAGIVCITTYIGYCFSKNYILRYKIYNQLNEFLSFYKLEIGYSQKKLIDIINEFLESNRVDYIGLNKFYKFLEFSIYENGRFEFEDDLKSLSLEEIKQIEDIFNSLGKYDLMQEMEKVEIQIIKIKSRLNDTLEERKKYCGFSIKIGVLLGCFIILLII